MSRSLASYGCTLTGTIPKTSSSITATGVLAASGDNSVAGSTIDDSGWMRLDDSKLTNSDVTNQGVLAIDQAHINASNIANAGWANLGRADISNGATGQLRNTGVLSTVGASITGNQITNGGWLNLDGAKVGASEISNTGVMTLTNQTVNGVHLTNHGTANLEDGVINGASTVENSGVISVKRHGDAKAAEASATAPTKEDPTQTVQQSPSTAITASALPKYPGTTITSDGTKSITDYDLSDVTEINNSGWLSLNGTLRSDVKITNHGVMSVHGDNQLDAATIKNTGWLGFD